MPSPSWAAPRVEDRAALFHALTAAGFTPRDRNRSTPGTPSGWYFRSNRRPLLGRRVLRPTRASRWERRPVPVYLDHREDWQHPDFPDLWTALATWHLHGCLHPDRPPSLPTPAPHNRPPEPFPTLWAGPSWYWPGAVVGVTFHPAVAELASEALDPFRVG